MAILSRSMFSRGRRPGSTPHFRFQCVALRHASGFAVRSRKTWTKAIAHLLRENASENGKSVERLGRLAKYEAMLALLLDCKITVRTLLIAVGLLAAFPATILGAISFLIRRGKKIEEAARRMAILLVAIVVTLEVLTRALPESSSCRGDPTPSAAIDPTPKAGWKTILVGSTSEEADHCVAVLSRLPDIIGTRPWRLEIRTEQFTLVPITHAKDESGCLIG